MLSELTQFVLRTALSELLLDGNKISVVPQVQQLPRTMPILLP
jgi:hypothetical protein